MLKCLGSMNKMGVKNNCNDYNLNDLYSCPIEIIKGLTDKGQFQYLTRLKWPQ